MADFRPFRTLVDMITPGVPGCPLPVITQRIRDVAIDVCERSLVWRHVITPFKLTPLEGEYRFDTITPDTREFNIEITDGTLYTDDDGIRIDDDGYLMFDVAGAIPFEDSATLATNVVDARIDDDSMLWVVGEDEPIVVGPPLDDTDIHTVLAAAISTDGITYQPITPLSNEEFFERFPGWPNAPAGTPAYITQLSGETFCLAPLPKDDEDVTFRIALVLSLKPRRSSTSMDGVVMAQIADVIVHGALHHLMLMQAKAWFNEKLASYHGGRYTFLLNMHRANANLTTPMAHLTARAKGYWGWP